VTEADSNMINLFRNEMDVQCDQLRKNLIKVEENGQNVLICEALARSAHSIKGAARLVNIKSIQELSHLLEEIFNKTLRDELKLDSNDVEQLMTGANAVYEIAQQPEEIMRLWDDENKSEYNKIIEQLTTVLDRKRGSREIKKSKPAAQSVKKKPASKKTGTTVSASTEEVSMLDLFITESDEQASILSENILILEKDPNNQDCLEALMRAAHSLKGAARMVGVEAVLKIAHHMEDVFEQVKENKRNINADNIDILLKGVDLIAHITHLNDSQDNDVIANEGNEIESLIGELSNIVNNDDEVNQVNKESIPTEGRRQSEADEKIQAIEKASTITVKNKQAINTETKRNLKVSSEKWDQLMGLAGEVKVESDMLNPYVNTMQHLKKQHVDLVSRIESLNDKLCDIDIGEYARELLKQIQSLAADYRNTLTEKIVELDIYDRRLTGLSGRLHKKTIETRMRPFSDGIHGFKRMVREVSRSLGKNVRLEIYGLSTQVDRDVLEKIEAPLNHIIRNAIDHGVESPQDRINTGKTEEATIILSASHREGLLNIVLEDDGKGIDLELLRTKIVEKDLITKKMAETLSDKELIEFLFLPSFTTRDEVTEISGRGVGLDVVNDTVRAMAGRVAVTTLLGQGTKFELQLPLTLSILSSLIVMIADEPYAFPLTKILRTVKLPTKNIEIIEGQQYVTIDGQHIGLVGAAQLFELEADSNNGGDANLIIITDRDRTYAINVDEIIGQRELAVQKIDSRLGKLQSISASAILHDGTPVLILDVDDLLNSIDVVVKGGELRRINKDFSDTNSDPFKRILVIDDSLTVREVVRSMLEGAGYKVDVAIDGVDGWNAVRASEYDIVISDIDMPRMNGFELVRNIKTDRRLSNIPVIIVSYKEREEDKIQGMDAGADYYLTKGSFHDETLLNAIHDLIGEE
jgi:two-component system sensor histidine kinase and response regulator WspE